MQQMDNCINRAMRRFFVGIGSTASMRQMRIYYGLSSISDLIEIRKRNFTERLIESDS